MENQQYVAGFMFSEDMNKLALIHKIKGPPGVKGNWNAIGGKIDSGESSIQAMVREFKEETGVDTEQHEWRNFCRLIFPYGTVHFYVCFSNKVFDVKTIEEEQVHIWNTSVVLNLDNKVQNLNWLIPFCLNKDMLFGTVIENQYV